MEEEEEALGAGPGAGLEGALQRLEARLERELTELGAGVGAGAGAGDEVQRVQALGGGVRQGLRLVARLREEAEDRGDDAEGRRLLGAADGHEGTLKRLKAKLQARGREAAAARVKRLAEDRRELLSGADARQQRQREEGEAGLLSKSGEITESLLRIRNLMGQEIDHGASTLELMDQGESTLRNTKKEYERQSPFLEAGQKLLKVLKDQDRREELKVYAAFSFFISVVLYITIKRVRYFVWIPSFLTRAAAGGAPPPPDVAGTGEGLAGGGAGAVPPRAEL